MYELIAIGLGIALGYHFSGAPTLRRALTLTLPPAAVVGATMTAMSGELELSVGFLLLDVGQTVAAATLTLLLAWRAKASVSKHG